MNSKYKNKKMRARITYTIILAVLLLSVFFGALTYVYSFEKKHSLDSLHISTEEIKEDVELQMYSDQENLVTMSRFAADLYARGKGFDIILESFEFIGLIEEIGILMPDNSFVTANGTIENVKELEFEVESTRGSYISGKTKDITNPDREVVRSAVPIISDNKTVAILYGVVKLETIEERYKNSYSLDNSMLVIFERDSGDYIINTSDSTADNITDLSEREFSDGYTYPQLIHDIKEEGHAYSSFTKQDGEYMYYVHFASTTVSNWVVLLAKPEADVFSKASDIGKVLTIIFVLAVLFMSLYLLLIFSIERKQSRLNHMASVVRKLLLEINNNVESITDALMRISQFAKSRSAIFINSSGEEYKYISPAHKNKILPPEDRKKFADETMKFAMKRHKENSTYVSVYRVEVNSELKLISEDYYNLLSRNNIYRVTLAAVSSNSGNMSVIATINPKKSLAIKLLLEEVAVCFSMAMSNRRYLNKTEVIAVTDSLTGLSNRLAYKKDIARFDANMCEDFSCVYIDVNELHIINNKFGHARGDSMLIYIANSLKEVFSGNSIYRMGGDEFLVFIEGEPEDVVNELIKKVNKKVEEKDYHVSIGMSFSSQNLDADKLVKDAEKRMYEAKAEYYQRKERKNFEDDSMKGIEHITTGIQELDALLSIVAQRYLGIYCVSLKSDIAKEILMPAYLKKFAQEDKHFSRIFSMYVHEAVDPDYHRAMLSFLEYDVIKRQILDGQTPGIIYSRADGRRYRLTVYPLSVNDEENIETIWVFERDV